MMIAPRKENHDETIPRAASRIERKAMINAEHELSLTRPLLDLSWASLYYTPVQISEADLRLMRASTSCTWSCRSPAVACCAICSKLKG